MKRREGKSIGKCISIALMMNTVPKHWLSKSNLQCVNHWAWQLALESTTVKNGWKCIVHLYSINWLRLTADSDSTPFKIRTIRTLCFISYSFCTSDLLLLYLASSIWDRSSHILRRKKNFCFILKYSRSFFYTIHQKRYTTTTMY